MFSSQIQNSPLYTHSRSLYIDICTKQFIRAIPANSWSIQTTHTVAMKINSVCSNIQIITLNDFTTFLFLLTPQDFIGTLGLDVVQSHFFYLFIDYCSILELLKEYSIVLPYSITDSFLFDLAKIHFNSDISFLETLGGNISNDNFQFLFDNSSSQKLWCPIHTIIRKIIPPLNLTTHSPKKTKHSHSHQSSISPSFAQNPPIHFNPFIFLPSTITELCGTAATGKTQFCSEIICQALAMENNISCLYITTEDGSVEKNLGEPLVPSTFLVNFINRIKKFLQFKNISPKLSHLFVESCSSNYSALESYICQRLPRLCETIPNEGKPNIGLVIIDSFTGSLRFDFSNSLSRSPKLFYLLNLLKILSSRYNFALILVNQMSARLNQDIVLEPSIPFLHGSQDMCHTIYKGPFPLESSESFFEDSENQHFSLEIHPRECRDPFESVSPALGFIFSHALTQRIVLFRQKCEYQCSEIGELYDNDQLFPLSTQLFPVSCVGIICRRAQLIFSPCFPSSHMYFMLYQDRIVSCQTLSELILIEIMKNQLNEGEELKKNN